MSPSGLGEIASQATDDVVLYIAHPQQIRHCEEYEAISPSSLQDSFVAFTRLTPRWYIKRAMREIASFLAMTVGAGDCCNQRGLSSPGCLIEKFLTLVLMFRSK